MESSLSLYWELASPDASIRRKSAASLVQVLLNFQSQFSSANQELKFISQIQEIDLVCSPDLAYGLKRLLRGLPSSREGARLGFSMALAEVLKIMPPMQTQVFLDLLLSLTDSKTSVKGQEERDIYFGRIFGIMAYCQSGLLKGKFTTALDVQRILDLLLEYSQAKMYLRIPCFHVLILVLEEIKETDYSKSIFEFASQRILSNGMTSCDDLWVALVLNYDLGVTDGPVECQDILKPKNLSRLVHLLKESTFASPIIHPVWKCILGHSLKNMGFFIPFWNALDGTYQFLSLKTSLEILFHSTHDRKYLGFWIFQTCLPWIEPSSVSLLFTPSFLRCLMNNLSRKDTYLHKMAQETANCIRNTCQEQPMKSFDILLQLTGENGSLFFDSVSKTKTIDGMLHTLSKEQVIQYISRLESTFLSLKEQETTPETQKNAQVVQTRVLEQLYCLVKNPKIPKESDWIQNVIEFLCFQGLFKNSQESSCCLATKTRNLCLEKLNMILCSPLIVSGKKTSGQEWSRLALGYISSLMDSKEVGLVHSLDSSLVEHFQEAFKLVESIQEKQVAEDVMSREQLRAFEHLVSFLIIQGLSDPEELVHHLEDLENCFKQLWPVATKKASSKKKRARSEPEQEAETLDPMDVLLDVLIGLLSKSSSSTRSLVVEVFKSLANRLTDKSLDIIFDVLRSKDDLEKKEDMEEGSDLDSMDIPMDSSILSLENHEENDKDDELLGDEEMEAFDSKLAEILGQKKQEKAHRKDMKRITLHFKSRVVDLIEAFIQAEPSNPLLLNLLSKLMRCIFEIGDLQDRLVSVLKNKLLKTKECPKLDDIPSGFALELLQEIHAMASKAKDSSSLQICSLASIYVVRIFHVSFDLRLCKKSKKEMESALKEMSPVAQVYATSLVDFMTKNKTNIKPSLFYELLNRYSGISWELFPELVRLVSKSVHPKAYPMTQAFNMMARIVKQSHGVPEEEIKALMGVQLPLLSNHFRENLECHVLDTEGQYCINKERLKDMLKDLLSICKKTLKSGWMSGSELQEKVGIAELIASVESFVEKNPKMEKNASLSGLLQEWNRLAS